MGRILQIGCGIVLALTLGGSAQPQLPQSQPRAANQSAKASEKARQQRPPVMITLSPAKEKRQADDRSTAGDAGPSGPSLWYDLWAQGLMALWALLQLGLTAIGIWYIRKTLIETEKAVAEAGAATSAARDAVVVTRESAERQLRAYVHVTEALTFPLVASERARAVLKIVNCGQTPATITRLVYAMGHDPDDGDWQLLGVPADRRKSMGPGTIDMLSLATNVLTPATIKEIELGTVTLYAFGVVEYEDAWEVKRSTHFRYDWFFDPSGKASLRACVEGNEAT